MKIKKILPNGGLTLTELLVATILVGIVMMGVVSFSYSIKRMQGTTDKRVLLGIRTAAAMNHIRKNVSLAVGYKNDSGIIQGAGDQVDGEPMDWISFRQDRQQTPDDYTDDVWVIYRIPIGAHELLVCEQKTTEQGGQGPVPLIKEGPCANDQAIVLSKELEKAVFQVTKDYSNEVLNFYIDITLKTRFFPKGEESALSNPSYEISTRIFPQQHSW